MGINTSGVDGLSASLGKAQASVGKMAQVVVRKSAKDIEGSAKRMAPVDTGRLKNSITTSDLRSVGTSGTLSAEIGPTADYGIYLELGTSNMAPQPFMGPATDLHEPAFIKAMEQLGGRLIE